MPRQRLGRCLPHLVPPHSRITSPLVPQSSFHPIGSLLFLMLLLSLRRPDLTVRVQSLCLTHVSRLLPSLPPPHCSAHGTPIVTILCQPQMASCRPGRLRFDQTNSNEQRCTLAGLAADGIAAGGVANGRISLPHGYCADSSTPCGVCAGHGGNVCEAVRASVKS